MYCRWISVFSCASFSHSSFRLQRDAFRIIISDLYILITSLILIHHSPSLIHKDRPLEAAQWSMIHWPWHHPFCRSITSASASPASPPSASVHDCSPLTIDYPCCKVCCEVHTTWSSKEKVVIWIRSQACRAPPLINSTDWKFGEAAGETLFITESNLLKAAAKWAMHWNGAKCGVS